MAAENQQNPGVKNNIFIKGMNKDTTDIFMSDQAYTHAINAINNSHTGETGTISNEPANEFYVSAPYTIIGAIYKSKNEWVICSTNDDQSEIGIFNEANITYTTVINDRCLNFKTTHPITGVCKENYDCTYSFYFQDNNNPDRVLNLDRIPYIQTGEDRNGDCVTPIYSNSLDCDALRLHPLVTQPCVKIKKGISAGQIANGSYMAVVAYSENGVRLTDYSLPSQPQGLWGHTGIGGSLEITVDTLDQDFNEYELVLIGVINQQAVARKIGNYSIRQTTVPIDIFSASLPVVDLSEIPLQKTIYEKSEKMFAVNGYLIRSSVTSQPFINYQQQANNIIAEWVAVEYPSNYYALGGNTVGYMRDEIYPFFIRWVYKTGSRSASYHIPGRAQITSDTEIIETPDALDSEQYRWQVYDTSTINPVTTGEVTADGGKVVARGRMGYWESSEKYPDDKPNIWGDYCGKPIRHHKMPSNEKIHIHNQGGTSISVLGVQFSNIEHPLDENGIPITDIVGYEILRGSRDGNKSVIAKGQFNNMRPYSINGLNTGTVGLIQNYPYNDLRPDPFLTSNYASLEDSSIPAPTLSTPFSTTCYSFHSPDTNFVRPYLGSNYIKIYNQQSGIVKGNYELPYKHPKGKLLTNKAFTTAFLVGLGISVVNAIGDVNGQAARSVGVLTQTSGVGTGQATGVFRVGASILNQAASLVTLGAFGLIAAYASTVVFTIAQIAYFGALGADQVLRTIYNFSKFRDHMIQFNSHGFYSNHFALPNGASGSSAPSFRRKIKEGGAKYVGSGIQDVGDGLRINNLFRNKYVFVNLDSSSPIPAPILPDLTRRTIGSLGIDYSKPQNAQVEMPTSSYYGSIKVQFQNQYGQLQSIIQLPTSSCVYSSSSVLGKLISSTDVIFGGDTYINRYTEKNPYYFFNTWLSGEQDGYEFDYRKYINGPCPKYWVNFDQYDMGDFNIQSQDQSGGTFAGNVIRKITKLQFTTPVDFYRLDSPSSGQGKFVVKKGWAYLFYNGVRDFFVESEINLGYRDYGEQDYEKFYDPHGDSFSDLSTMFRSDIITKPIMYKYDLSLSTARLFTNFSTWGSILPRDYDPVLYSSCFEYYPKRVVYSLQQQSGLKRDNWKNFLPLNYKDFNSKVTSIKGLNAQGSVILFENAEPVMFVGVDKLETKSGSKFLIGDGGLFAENNLQGIVNADDSLNYGTSISSRSAVNTPFGLFWISQKTGKLMQYSGGLKEISKNGLKFWVNQNLPSKLLQQYPDYPLYDNPIAGIGCQTTYDQQYELVYFSKKDYIAKRTDFLFDDPSGVPYYPCGLTPPTPIQPVPLDIHSVICSSTPSPNCLIDIVIAVDTSGSTGGPTGSIGNAERQFVKQFLENPDIVAAMQDGDIQVGLVNWSSQAMSMNPDGFTMSSSLTGVQAYNWLTTNWYSSGTSISPALSFSQNVLNNKTGSEQGDRSSQPGFKQIIIFVTDTGTAPANGVGCVYQSSTLGGGASGPANQFLYAVYAGATSAIPNDPSVLSYISCNKPAYEFGVAGNNPASISNVASAIAGASCTPPATCNFESTEYSITEGQQVILTWNAPYAVSATLNGQSVSPCGYAYALPLNAPFTTYTLVTTNIKGTVKTCNLKIDVTQRQPTVKKCFCPFDDSRCFESAGWTLSYDPKAETFVSFHDWIPDLTIPSYDHFFTIKGNSIWKHNSRHDLFNNYYGVSRPWEIEMPVVNVNNVTTLRNVEFTMEGYKYFNDGLDFNHVLDATFDSAIIHNSEQNSGILKLKMKDKNNPFELIQQPNITPFYTEILVAKEENKYRFNQFWDNTDDRGEFSLDQTPMWVTSENGYTRAVNPLYINYNKPPLQRKKFRHYGNKIVLRKTSSTDVKMILKLGSTKHLNSPR